jgi:hypothetical protein
MAYKKKGLSGLFHVRGRVSTERNALAERRWGNFRREWSCWECETLSTKN